MNRLAKYNRLVNSLRSKAFSYPPELDEKVQRILLKAISIKVKLTGYTLIHNVDGSCAQDRGLLAKNGACWGD